MGRVVNLFDWTGAVTRVNIEDHKIDIVSEQLVDPIIEANRFLNNNCSLKEMTSDFGRLRARIPMQTYMNLMKDGTLSDDKRLKKWLNDPDNRAFQTSKGRF